jgi:hypothetical protein
VHLYRLERAYDDVRGRAPADGPGDVDPDLLDPIQRLTARNLPYYWKFKRVIDFLERTGALPFYRRVFHRKAPGSS